MEQLTRKEGRQHTERTALDEFLDGQWWGVLNLGNVTRRNGRSRPLAVPTLFVRHGERPPFFHTSAIQKKAARLTLR